MTALVIAYGHLPGKIARRYARDDEARDYLRQIAECALEKAAYAFDPTRGTFGNFATRELRRACARAAARRVREAGRAPPDNGEQSSHYAGV